MNKKTKYTLYSAAVGGIGNGILNIINQNNEIPAHPIDWSRVLKASLKGGVVCGTGGFLVGAYVDYQNDLERPLNTDAMLGSLIKRMRLKEHDRKFIDLCGKADWIIQSIRREFGVALKGEPFRFGSTKEGTALREKYDIDISVSFKPDSFATIMDMYLILEEFLKKHIGRNGAVRVRRQNVSVGIYFDLGNGYEGKVDIVPIKITRRKGNKTSGYMHKNGVGLFSTPTYQKTDPILLSKDKLSNTQKSILIALKKWKAKEDVPISSHLLRNLIKDAYSCNVNRIPYGLTEKIIMVLTHIRDYIESICLASIENTNNIITDIPDADKTAIRNASKKVIDDFQYQPNSIVGYFE